MTAAAVRLLPDPDSPTSDIRLERGTRRFTPWSGMEASSVPVRNPTARFSMSRSGGASVVGEAGLPVIGSRSSRVARA